MIGKWSWDHVSSSTHMPTLWPTGHAGFERGCSQHQKEARPRDDRPSLRSGFRTKCGQRSTNCVSHSDAIHSRVTPQSQARAYFSNLGAAHRNKVGHRSLKLNDRTVALTTDQRHMGDGDDVTAVNPHENLWVKLCLGIGNCPRRHAFASAVVDSG